MFEAREPLGAAGGFVSTHLAGIACAGTAFSASSGGRQSA